MTDAFLDSLVRESAASLKAMTAKKLPDLTQCHRYALFLAPLRNHGWVLGFMLVFLALLSGLMTQWTRAQIPLPTEKKADSSSTTAVPAATTTTLSESTSIPAGDDLENGEEPPPYAPSPATPTHSDAASALNPSPTAPAPAPAAKPTPRRSSAHYFVIGTACLLTSLSSLFLLALTIQTILFCVWGPLHDTATSVFYWVLFCIPAVFSSIAVGSWLLLFRDLFGPKVKARWPFEEAVVLLGIGILILFPFVVVGMAGMWVGQRIIGVVERCQAWCCSDALEEEANLGLPVEMPDRVVVEAEGNEDEGSGSRDEERMGLIGGAEK